MNFNESKYKKCINHLIRIKILIVISYLIIFGCIGIGIGIPITKQLNQEWYIIAICAGVSAIIGLILGLYSTWGIEMKIQEAYWKIDMLDELKKQTTLGNKSTPIAKTVVAIENKSDPAVKK